MSEGILGQVLLTLLGGFIGGLASVRLEHYLSAKKDYEDAVLNAYAEWFAARSEWITSMFLFLHRRSDLDGAMQQGTTQERYRDLQQRLLDAQLAQGQAGTRVTSAKAKVLLLDKVKSRTEAFQEISNRNFNFALGSEKLLDQADAFVSQERKRLLEFAAEFHSHR